jgi:hypothetical protein
MKKHKLILLFGMPRSGTTWIGKIFDSHPDTLYLHEPDSVVPDYELPLLLSSSASPEVQSRVKKLISRWLEVNSEKVIASRPFFEKSYLGPIQWQIFKWSAFACKAWARIFGKTRFNPIKLSSSQAEPIVVWKSIESLGRIGAFSEASSAKAIQLIRHPCGTIASTFKGESGGQFDGSIAISEDWDLFSKLLNQSNNKEFSLDDIKRMKQEEKLAMRWGLINDFALTQIQQKNGRVVKYEDVCRSPLAEINNLFKWAGLGMSKQTEQFIKESTSNHDDAYYSTKKDPLFSAYRWKEKLSEEQIVNIKAIIMQFESGQLYKDDFHLDNKNPATR